MLPRISRRALATATRPRWARLFDPTPQRQVSVDRPLPDVEGARRKNRFYFGAFCVTMVAALGAMIKYEDANSPIVSSTLLTLRRSPAAKALMGDNIGFYSPMPWIYGSAGIAREIVDFSYWAQGDAGPALVHFRAERVAHDRYRTSDWSITSPDGNVVDLTAEEYEPLVPASNSEEPGIRRAH